MLREAGYFISGLSISVSLDGSVSLCGSVSLNGSVSRNGSVVHFWSDHFAVRLGW